MDSLIIIILIAVCSLALLLTLFILIVYSGLFTNIKVGAGQPPIENVTILYKFGRSSYKDTGSIFTEVTSIAPKKKSLGIYYDDPDEVPTDELRWAVGVILAEGSNVADEALLAQFKKEGFTQFSFPSIQNVVKASFPCPTQISVLLGIYMVYPKLAEYVKERKLCAHPWIEIYDGENIHYMAPLSKQDQFYVPETQKVTKKQQLKQDGDSPLADNARGNRQQESMKPSSTEGYTGSGQDGNSPLTESVTGNDKLSQTSSSSKSRPTEDTATRSQSVHVGHRENRMPSGEVRSASVDTSETNTTPIRHPQVDSLTDESNPEEADSFLLDSSMCSNSSTSSADSDAASSFFSSEYSCSSINTVQNASILSDISKIEGQNAAETKLCKEL